MGVNEELIDTGSNEKGVPLSHETASLVAQPTKDELEQQMQKYVGNINNFFEGAANLEGLLGNDMYARVLHIAAKNVSAQVRGERSPVSPFAMFLPKPVSLALDGVTEVGAALVGRGVIAGSRVDALASSVDECQAIISKLKEIVHD